MASFDLGPEYFWPVVAHVGSLIPEPSETARRRPMGQGMMGMRGNSSMHPEERLGMMIDMPECRGWGEV